MSKVPLIKNFIAYILGNVVKMPRKGLEPPHLTAPEPKSGVSTNFTTWAFKRPKSYIFKSLSSILFRKKSFFSEIGPYQVFYDHRVDVCM